MDQQSPSPAPSSRSDPYDEEIDLKAICRAPVASPLGNCDVRSGVRRRRWSGELADAGHLRGDSPVSHH